MVTVILADFRGLDTLVEITVLATAIIGVALPAATREGVVSAVFRVIAPRLLGPALDGRGRALVKGYTDVGDGFSAGVIVGLAIALRYVALGPGATERGPADPAPRAGRRRVRAAGRPGGRLRAASLVGDPPFTHVPGPGEQVVHIGTPRAASPPSPSTSACSCSW